jgi:hypothetical protein
MRTVDTETHTRYARAVTSSKSVCWDIERDVLRGRRFEHDQKLLPDSLSMLGELAWPSDADRRLLSQIQGRTYAGIFGLVERFINAKVLEVSGDHRLGDQVALEALVRFSAEELKHQELFRRIERMLAEGMPAGYQLVAEPDAVAQAVLARSTWAVLGLTCHIELFTLVHYKASIAPDPELSALFKDVFLYHWKEESQHAILDELEWRAEDRRLSAAERDAAVDDLIALVGAVDGILVAQAGSDARYFAAVCGRSLSAEALAALDALLRRAYRWQYILSGVKETRFGGILGSMITEAQMARVGRALAGLSA